MNWGLFHVKCINVLYPIIKYWSESGGLLTTATIHNFIAFRKKHLLKYINSYWNIIITRTSAILASVYNRCSKS